LVRSPAKQGQVDVSEQPLTQNTDHRNLSMSVHVSTYLKQLIRILQTGRSQLDAQIVRSMVDSMITNQQLLVVANTLPLYLVL
jgi:hypothetical protein